MDSFLCPIDSAGGYTTLAALTASNAADRALFRAGCSLYGVADLAALAGDTHKFESRYLDRLVGPLPAAAALYAQRSPLTRLDALSCPIVLFQGSDDKVVPPNQAHMMVAAMREYVECAECVRFLLLVAGVIRVKI